MTAITSGCLVRRMFIIVNDDGGSSRSDLKCMNVWERMGGESDNDIEYGFMDFVSCSLPQPWRHSLQ